MPKRPQRKRLLRQPVHTVYGGAHLFEAGVVRKLGQRALTAVREYAADAGTFAECFGLRQGTLPELIHRRIVAKLQTEPVEDFRIDFEDGYGPRPDSEEDQHARSAAEEVARGLEQGTLPPFIGIRIKAFRPELRRRAERTLHEFFNTLLARSGRRLPQPFLVTLPKVKSAREIALLADRLRRIEARHRLAPGSLSIELMVETPDALFDSSGRLALPTLVRAAKRRCTGAHLGPYDYTAALEVTAPFQALGHPACTLARQLMKISLANTAVSLSDGPTTLLPIAPHRGPNALSLDQRRENRQAIHRAWRLAYENIGRALSEGFYQGWDLHPNQLPVRYAAVYAFFLESVEPMTDRLKSFIDRAAQATQSRGVFDDAATGQGLLNFFRRGLLCGALTEREVGPTGLSIEEAREGSFLDIVDRRRKSRT